jgi:hypothetical protein
MNSQEPAGRPEPVIAELEEAIRNKYYNGKSQDGV